MKRTSRIAGLVVLLTTAFAAFAAVVATPASSGASTIRPTSELVIRHATVGCHVWAVSGGARTAYRRVLQQNQSFTVDNRDNCAQTLVQTSGDAVRMEGLTPGVEAGVLVPLRPGVRVTLEKPGVYEFTTTEASEQTYNADGTQEFGFARLASTGPDNILKLVVQVLPDRNHPLEP